MTTIAESLEISPDAERVWRIGDTQYVYTPARAASSTVETLTRQRVIGDQAASTWPKMGRLQYLNATWAAKNAALFASAKPEKRPMESAKIRPLGSTLWGKCALMGRPIPQGFVAVGDGENRNASGIVIRNEATGALCLWAGHGALISFG